MLPGVAALWPCSPRSNMHHSAQSLTCTQGQRQTAGHGQGLSGATGQHHFEFSAWGSWPPTTQAHAFRYALREAWAMHAKAPMHGIHAGACMPQGIHAAGPPGVRRCGGASHLHIHAGGQVQGHELVDGGGGQVLHINQPLVQAHLGAAGKWGDGAVRSRQGVRAGKQATRCDGAGQQQDSARRRQARACSGAPQTARASPCSRGATAARCTPSCCSRQSVGQAGRASIISAGLGRQLLVKISAGCVQQQSCPAARSHGMDAHAKQEQVGAPAHAVKNAGHGARSVSGDAHSTHGQIGCAHGAYILHASACMQTLPSCVPRLGHTHRVGSGTGPAMVAPVLLAASRIFSTESASRSTQ